MKDEVLKRKMFSTPMGKDVNNVGIMAGFMDDDESKDDEYEDMNEEAASAELSRRTPQSPEILMNNLRGDIRSVDARYEELAQMVGEQAAMETPPEVLAMLQGQMAQQQGIGALPQAPAMPPEMMGQQPMPPEMMGGQPPMPPEMMAQAPMPMPQEPMPMDQGAMPPQGFADGGIVRLQAGGDPQIAALLQRNFGARGASPMAAPSFSRGLSLLPGAAADYLGNLGTRLARSPLTRMGGYAGLAVGLGDAVTQAARGLRGTFGDIPIGASNPDNFRPQGLSAAQTRALGMPDTMRDTLDRQLLEGAVDATGSVITPTPMFPAPSLGPVQRPMFTEQELIDRASRMPAAPPLPTEIPAEPIATATEAAPGEERAPTVQVKEAPQTEAEKTKTFIERVRQRKGELAPLFEELTSGDKNSQEIQALMLLADAGMKLARGSGRPGTSFATELAFAAEGIPGGMAKLAAQKAERDTQVKTAALTAAINKVESEDKAVRDIQIAELQAQRDWAKLQLQYAGVEEVDLGAGLIKTRDKLGRTIATTFDPEVISSFANNSNTVNPNLNPFAQPASGSRPLLLKDKAAREKTAGEIADIDSTLIQLDNISPVLEKAYGPGSFVSKLREGIFVPLGVSTKPVDVKALSQAQQLYAGLRSSMARVAGGDTSRLSNQEQEWAQETLGAKPGSFFSNPEQAAKQMLTMRTYLQNLRMVKGAALGYTDTLVQSEVPNTGTKNDPFVIPSDPQKQITLAGYITDAFRTRPEGSVYLRLPNGKVDQFPVRSLVDLVKTQ